MKKDIITKVKILSCIFALSTSVMIPAAGEAKTKKPVLNKKTATINVGGEIKLKVKNYKKKVTWKSSKKSIAVVSKKGVVKGKKKGKAVITAKAGKKKLKCKITVNAVTNNKNTQTTPQATSKPVATQTPVATATQTPKPIQTPSSINNNSQKDPEASSEPTAAPVTQGAVDGTPVHVKGSVVDGKGNAFKTDSTYPTVSKIRFVMLDNDGKETDFVNEFSVTNDEYNASMTTSANKYNVYAGVEYYESDYEYEGEDEDYDSEDEEELKYICVEEGYAIKDNQILDIKLPFYEVNISIKDADKIQESEAIVFDEIFADAPWNTEDGIYVASYGEAIYLEEKEYNLTAMSVIGTVEYKLVVNVNVTASGENNFEAEFTQREITADSEIKGIGSTSLEFGPEDVKRVDITPEVSGDYYIYTDYEEESGNDDEDGYQGYDIDAILTDGEGIDLPCEGAIKKYPTEDGTSFIIDPTTGEEAQQEVENVIYSLYLEGGKTYSLILTSYEDDSVKLKVVLSDKNDLNLYASDEYEEEDEYYEDEDDGNYEDEDEETLE